jgi:hypothetical protein
MSAITANQRAAHLLRVKAPALAEAIMAEHYRQRPELERQYGPVGKKRCLEDALFHLRFLAGSVEFGDPKVFADYSAWVGELLARRRIPVEHVAENLRVTGAVLHQALPAEAVELIGPHLDAALARLATAGDQSADHTDAVSRAGRRLNRTQVRENLPQASEIGPLRP